MRSLIWRNQVDVEYIYMEIGLISRLNFGSAKKTYLLYFYIILSFSSFRIVDVMTTQKNIIESQNLIHFLHHHITTYNTFVFTMNKYFSLSILKVGFLFFHTTYFVFFCYHKIFRKFYSSFWVLCVRVIFEKRSSASFQELFV